MSLSALCIRRPVALTLLTLGFALSGALACVQLPVAPLPNLALPTIVVNAQMPGGSPDTMAATVAGPLERHLEKISDLMEISSTSGVDTTQIVLQFGLDRDIDGAARDVEAAIQAARADLPAALPANPTYNKVNPTDAPIMILALTSDTMPLGQLYDSADTLFAQLLSQVQGVGEVQLEGAALPAVRVYLQPGPLNMYGIGLEDVRAALAAANANAPKGYIDTGPRRMQIYTNDQSRVAADYRDLVIAYRDGQAVRLSDIAAVTNGVEDVEQAAFLNGRNAVLVIVQPTPTANVIQTVDQIRAILPFLKASLPASAHLTLVLDRSVSIRGALGDTERTLFIAIFVVIGVVFAFLRSPRATLIPAIVVPATILCSFGPMYLLGFSLDNFSLMALVVATSFIVDDTVVVVENVLRHIEAGEAPLDAALRGSAEVNFTLVAMSLALIAVLIPVLLLTGLLTGFFLEFSVTLFVTILISLIVSLTLTPTLCAALLKPESEATRRLWIEAQLRRGFNALQAGYARSLRWALRHARLVGFGLLLTISLNVVLLIVVPSGFLPDQDSGLIVGSVQADQTISFPFMRQKVAQIETIIRANPSVASVVSSLDGSNNAELFITLKPLPRPDALTVVAQLRPGLAKLAGARSFLSPYQDLSMEAQDSTAQYQYTLQSEDAAALQRWVPRIVTALQANRLLLDVSSDIEQGGLATNISMDRNAAARLGITPSEIDNTLYDAFGQRAVSTIYGAANQYEVIMQLAPPYLTSPATLDKIYISTAGGTASGTQQTNAPAGTVAANGPLTASRRIAPDSATNQDTNAIATGGSSDTSSGSAVSTDRETMIPLSAVAHYAPGPAPNSVNHEGGQLAATISFNLPDKVALGSGVDAVERTMQQLDVPLAIHAQFTGTAAAFQSAASTEPLLILAAFAAVYIVLGILYESTIHPLTIISTIPPAGLGAVFCLLMLNMPLTIIALIGIILLIGIVQKNAILMVDVAIQLRRGEPAIGPEDAIFQAALLRFRPILMTSFAAILGALPLAIGFGQGSSFRQPLGITIMGGLLVSQALTLYTTPVVYLALERLAARPPATGGNAVEAA